MAVPGIYQWKAGHRFMVDAQVIGETVASLAEARGGSLAPGDLVEHARSPNSPAHKLFEWDDSVAAHQYRVATARMVIGALVVSVTMGPKKPAQELRAFVNVMKDDVRGYTSLRDAMDDPDLRTQVVQRALDELRQWKTKYAQYKELAAVHAAIAAAEMTKEVELAEAA